MKTLTYNFQPLLGGAVVVTAKLIRRDGSDVWLCDVFEQLEEAMDAGAPFVAHAVKGMEPVDLIVNPANVATIERVG